MHAVRAARTLLAFALFVCATAVAAGGAQAAPSVSIKFPVNGAILSADARKMLVASPRGSRLKCRIDRGKRRACKRRTALRHLADGSHLVTVTAVTRKGTASVAATRFRVDTKAPVVTITTPVPGQIFTGLATATFKANESAKFTCRVDTGVAESCWSPASSNEIPDGRHVLTVTARDAAGNTGSAQVTFYVDRSSSEPAPEPVPDPDPAPEPAPEPTPEPTSPVPDPAPTSGAQATALDSSHIRLTWQSPASAANAEIVRRDLVDPTPDVVVGTVPAASGSYTDAQLWFSNSYRYTITFKDLAGATVGTLTASATTPAVTAASFPVPFVNNPYIGAKLTSSTPMAPSDVNTRYRNYLASHLRNPNLTLRAYGVPVYEARGGDRLIGPFSCGYNCQLPRTGSASVPLPVKPKPVGILGLGLMADPGSDRHMSIVAADGNTAWDFYHPDEDNTDVDKTNPAVWQFIYAGATFSPKAANPVIATPPPYAAANAANFSNLAGLLRPEELALGEIRHPLMMGVPGIGTAVAGTNTPACPATHNAMAPDPATGTTNPDAPPEGLRFRLNPNFDVNSLTRPWERMIAKAMQDYGVYVRDNSGTVAIYGETTSLNATTGDTRGGRGYDGWNKAKAGLSTSANSQSFSAAFPWNQLEVVSFTPGPNCG